MSKELTTFAALASSLREHESRCKSGAGDRDTFLGLGRVIMTREGQRGVYGSHVNSIRIEFKNGFNTVSTESYRQEAGRIIVSSLLMPERETELSIVTIAQDLHGLSLERTPKESNVVFDEAYVSPGEVDFLSEFVHDPSNNSVFYKMLWLNSGYASIPETVVIDANLKSGYPVA